MAIIFDKQLTLTDLLFSYNNNTVTFKSNSVLTVSKATVSFNGLVFTLFPDPANKFYFNFKYSISTLLNGTNNFSQLYDLGVNPLIDYTDYIYKDFAVTYKIFFTNDTSETQLVNYNFLSAYVNTQDYKKLYPQYPFQVQGQYILKPISYFKSWVGYPFDITYYDGEFSDLYFNVNGNESFLLNDNRINIIVFTNGNEIVVLQNGYNSITINSDEFYIEQISYACDGHYLKWLNSFGGWNYWLFNKGKDTLTTKDLGTIFNDYEDVVDTISPYVAIGKTSENNITVRQENITPQEFLILNDILESPKVYLFTGLQNEVVQANDWLEVTIKSGAFIVSNAREKMTNLNLTIELPANNTKTL